MGLARNLKRILTKLADKILVELSYHYIKQRAKQTSKRLEDSSSTMSSSNPLTTENPHTTIATSSADTSEKIIMETQIEPVVQVRDWCIDRIDHLTDVDCMESYLNAVAIAEEFSEWIDVKEGDGELEYLSMEDKGFGDQEIDVI